jgi:hypothetical protein
LIRRRQLEGHEIFSGWATSIQQRVASFELNAKALRSMSS